MVATCSIMSTLCVVGQMQFDHRVLLTGTPVQNNLRELYSLLCFVAPAIFRYKYVDDFVDTYTDLSSANATSNGLLLTNSHILSLFCEVLYMLIN